MDKKSDMTVAERIDEVRNHLVRGGKSEPRADIILNMASVAYSDAIVALGKAVEEAPEFNIVLAISLELTAMRCREMLIEMATPSVH